MDSPKPSATVHVDVQGYIYADGVRIARISPDKRCLQFLDRDRRRSDQRGSSFVEVAIKDMANLVENKQVIYILLKPYIITVKPLSQPGPCARKANGFLYFLGETNNG